MKLKIFTFIKPSESATMFSHKMARFISQELGEPIYWNDEIDGEDLDLLIIVGGGMPFCRHYEALGKAVLRSENVVYCTNDYATTKLPAPDNHAKTPFRKSFRLRHKHKMKPPQVWSTLEEADAFINWNAIAWQPNFKWSEKNKPRLIYYGSWRRGRVGMFDKFFMAPKVSTVISNSSGRFEERYPKCEHIDSLTPNIVENLAQYGLGLYLKDPKSEIEPPACRFYEMLSAGLPMVFHHDCREMLSQYFDVADNTLVSDVEDIARAMRNRKQIAWDQTVWHVDHSQETKKQFHAAMKGLTK